MIIFNSEPCPICEDGTWVPVVNLKCEVIVNPSTSHPRNPLYEPDPVHTWDSNIENMYMAPNRYSAICKECGTTGWLQGQRAANWQLVEDYIAKEKDKK